MLGADHILFGSDWPHAEGLAEPTAFARDLRRHGFGEDEIRTIMAENGALAHRPGRWVRLSHPGNPSPTTPGHRRPPVAGGLLRPRRSLTEREGEWGIQPGQGVPPTR